jgi:glycosyltransferase involved in cell wall biosynthesis
MSLRVPKLSVGIPVRNGERFISDALDSLLGQTFEDLEIVIGDNASDDRTEDICRSYAARDDRVRYIRHRENLGLVGNFNSVFHAARGQYFKWAAHDDLISPTYLERTVDALDSDASIVLATMRVTPIEADGTPIHFDSTSQVYVTSYGETLPPIHSPEQLGSPLPHERFRDIVLFLTSNVLAAFIYGVARSRFLAQTSLMDDYVGSEKVYLAELSLRGRLVELPEEGFYRRFHPAHFGRASLNEASKQMKPGSRGFHFSGAKQINGYFRAVRRTPLPARDKARCLMAIVEKVGRVSATRAARLTRIREGAAAAK